MKLMKLLKVDKIAHSGKNLECRCLKRCLWVIDRVFRPENYYNKLWCLCSIENWPVYTWKLFYHLQPNYTRSSILGRTQLTAMLNHAKYSCKFILISPVLNHLTAVVYLPTVSQTSLFWESALQRLLSAMMGNGRSGYKLLVISRETKRAPPKSAIKLVFTSHSRRTIHI